MKKHSKIVLILLVIVFTGIWIFGQNIQKSSAYEVNENQLIFRMADHRISDYPSNIGVRKFARLVEERTNGDVKILIYDQNALGNETNIVEQIAFGGIDFARVSTLYMQDFAPIMGDLLVPDKFENEAEMMDNFNEDKVSIAIREGYKSEKINILALYPGAVRGIFHKKETIDALLGGKIGVPESQIKIDEIGALGFLPIPSKSENINSYLKANYIEGAEGDLLDYYFNENYVEAPNFTTLYWSMIPEAIIVSNTAIKKLTTEQQRIIYETANEVAGYITELTKEKEREVRDELVGKGILFHNEKMGK